MVFGAWDLELSIAMKYLIIYASAGAGHRKAAEAVYEALLERVDEKDIEKIDSLDYTNRLFKWFYARKYITLVNYMPHVWGFFYYLFDNWFVYKLLWLPRRVTNALNCGQFEKFILKVNPEAVISTHFMANEVVSRLKQKGRINCKLFSVVTDYRIHSFWVAPYVDRYFVASERTKADLSGWGIFDDKISVTGIPISSKFSLKLDKNALANKFGLDTGIFTALIIGGGFGVGPVEELVQKIGALKLNAQFLIVCGYNKDLLEKINVLKQSLGLKAMVYGFVDNVHELMSLSNVLVTKSGGLTSSEAMAKGLATIFVKPIPGQEKRNSNVLQLANAAVIAKNVDEARKKIKEIYEDPELLHKMSNAANKMAKPDSARDVVNIICT